MIISTSSDKFKVFSDGAYYELSARGVLKIKSEGIKVGDKVEFDEANILSVLPRKNYIARLNAANVDSVNIIVSPIPKPDFLLVDKIIALSRYNGCMVYMTVNKSDVDDGLISYVLKHYSSAVDEIFIVSAKNGEGLDALKKELKSKLVVFAGQSAVGKTSITNKLFLLSEKTDDVSVKTGRGRHTTTRRRIMIGDGLFVVDTPGFSFADISDIPSSELKDCYKDFAEYNGKCYYIGCRHVAEPDCLLKEALSGGKISDERYSRYLTLLKEIVDNEKRRY